LTSHPDEVLWYIRTFDAPLERPDTEMLIRTPPSGILSADEISTAASTSKPILVPILSAMASCTAVRSSVPTGEETSSTESDPDSTVVSSFSAVFFKSDSLSDDGLANTVIPMEKTISTASIPANFFFIGFSSFL
jgi:hypothetical protein